jgi:hypothetical protein
MGGISVLIILLLFSGPMMVLSLLPIIVDIYIAYAIIVCIGSLVVYYLIHRKGLFHRFHNNWKELAMKCLKWFLIVETILTFLSLCVAIYLKYTYFI